MRFYNKTAQCRTKVKGSLHVIPLITLWVLPHYTLFPVCLWWVGLEVTKNPYHLYLNVIIIIITALGQEESTPLHPQPFL